MYIIPLANCNDGDIRLGNGTRTRGNLEVCRSGLWRVVTRFNHNTASLVCKQLGYLEYPGKGKQREKERASTLHV